MSILALNTLSRNHLFDRRKLGLIWEAAGNKDDWLRQVYLDRIPVNEHARTEQHPDPYQVCFVSQTTARSPQNFPGNFRISSQIDSCFPQSNLCCHQEISNFVIFCMGFYVVKFYLTILHVLRELEPFLAITIAAITSWRVYTELSTNIFSTFINI